MPSSPSRFSAGTSQSLNASGAVVQPCMPILSSFLPMLKPGKLRSTMNAEMPLMPFDRSVTAITVKTCASPALVM